MACNAPGIYINNFFTIFAPVSLLKVNALTKP